MPVRRCSSSAGSPEDVVIQLGHTDGGTLVSRLYGHPSEERARARIAAAFAHEPVANWSQASRNRLAAGVSLVAN